MPAGKGTYGNKVGRPPDNETSSDYSSILTQGSRKKEWTNFMTNMPKGYVTKEEMASKRKELRMKYPDKKVARN